MIPRDLRHQVDIDSWRESVTNDEALKIRRYVEKICQSASSVSRALPRSGSPLVESVNRGKKLGKFGKINPEKTGKNG